MVLDTKSKNTNYLIKMLCIFLSLLFVFICSYNVLNVLFTLSYTDFNQSVFEEGITTANSYEFSNQLAKDIEKIRIVSHCADLSDKEKEKFYDKYIYHYEYGDISYESSYYAVQRLESLKYYAVNTKTKEVMTNFPKGESYKNVLDKAYAAVILSDGIEKTTDTIREDFFAGDSNLLNDVDVYCYVDVIGNNDQYAKILQKIDSYNSSNIKTQAVFSAVCLVIAVLIALYSFYICGMKKEDGTVKLAITDYIPSELHFAISVGLIVGLVYLFDGILEEFYDSIDNLKYLSLFLSIIVAAVWAVLLEFITSFIRVCKSDKKLYKNLIIFWIFYGVYKLITLKLKFNKKVLRKIKSAVSYKPVNFKRRIIGLISGYIIINIFLIFAGSLFLTAWDTYYSDAPLLFGLFLILLDIAFNVVTAVFVLKYVMDLDRIISAAASRTMPMVNYNKLPQSLKILVNSLRYTNQELDAAVSRAVKDERMRTELITNVSHDLKTPLTSIINYVDLLSKLDIDNADAQEYIGVLDEKGKKLKRLVDDLVEASKVTSGVITLNKVNLNLNELAAQAVVESQIDFSNNDLELVFKGNAKNVVAFADGNKTYRILENLLSNARKYSARKTRVYADVYETQQYSVFEIKNISQEPLDISPDELTERFVRGDKSRTNEGNGLGLSIAKELCKAQNGVLDISIDGDLFKARVMLPKANSFTDKK